MGPGWDYFQMCNETTISSNLLCIGPEIRELLNHNLLYYYITTADKQEENRPQEQNTPQEQYFSILIIL